MSFADARRAIENRFATQFTALPVWYENNKFDIPTSGGYVVLTIRDGGGNQISTGSNPLHRYVGLIFVDIFVEEETGTQTARAHADTIEAIFRRAQFSAGNSGTILCRTPSITPFGVQAGWYRIQVDIPFQRDRIHS